MSRVFVVSSAFFAFINNKDSHHDEAMAILDRLARQGDELLTSNFVIAESHALLLNKLGRDVAARFLGRMVSSEVRVIRVTEGDERRAREIIFRYTDQTPCSLTRPVSRSWSGSISVKSPLSTTISPLLASRW